MEKTEYRFLDFYFNGNFISAQYDNYEKAIAIRGVCDFPDFEVCLDIETTEAFIEHLQELVQKAKKEN